ncbi:MAG: PorT family protein [Bacteroidales bacterium]|nr:PorT family protein [Bacteroidales bacterium]
MADHYQNIDKLFQKSLKGHKVKAPANAWNRLQNDLHIPERRGIFWITRAAAAAILLMTAFGGGYYFSKMNILNNDQLSEVIKPDTKTKEIKTSSTIESFVNNQPEIKPAEIVENTNDSLVITNPDHRANPSQLITASAENTNIFKDSDLSEPANPGNDKEQQASVVSTNETAFENSDELAKIQLSEFAAEVNTENKKPAKDIQPDNIQTQDAVPLLSDEMLHQMLISGNTDLSDALMPESESEKNSRWRIGGRLSPVYSYRNTNGDAFQTPDESVDAGYFNSNEVGVTSIAGGISLDYIINSRLSFGSGMYLSRIGQQNNEVLAYNDPNSTSMYKLTSSIGTVTINPKKFESVIIEKPASIKDSVPGDYIVNGSFVQNLDYLEVPLVLKYKILNKKFSVNILGGLSPGILVNNRSFFETDGEKLQTGTTQNIDPFIYNSIVGIGLDYAIGRKLSLNMEPSFKYSLSPVNSNNGINYHPYSLSWFTGISYKIY